jgi:hypothetical protein
MRVADAPALGRYIRDPKSFASELTAVDSNDRVDPEASDEELAIIESDVMATAVDFDDRGNELEDDPELNLVGDFCYSDADYQD